MDSVSQMTSLQCVRYVIFKRDREHEITLGMGMLAQKVEPGKSRKIADAEKLRDLQTKEYPNACYVLEICEEACQSLAFFPGALHLQVCDRLPNTAALFFWIQIYL